MRLICRKHKTRAAAIGCWHPERDRFKQSRIWNGWSSQLSKRQTPGKKAARRRQRFLVTQAVLGTDDPWPVVVVGQSLHAEMAWFAAARIGLKPILRGL